MKSGCCCCSDVHVCVVSKLKLLQQSLQHVQELGRLRASEDEHGTQADRAIATASGLHAYQRKNNTEKKTDINSLIQKRTSASSYRENAWQ